MAQSVIVRAEARSGGGAATGGGAPPFPPMVDAVEALRVVRAREAAGDLARTLKVKVFRNYSAEFIEPFLRFYFAEIGTRCEVSFGGYDTIQQDLLGGEDLKSYDLIVMSLTLDRLDAGAPEERTATAVMQRIQAMVDLALDRSSAPIILNTFVRPLLDEGGAAHALCEGSESARVVDLNHALRDYVKAKAPRCLLLDWERLVMLIGASAALDRRMGYLAAAPFRHPFLSGYAYEVFRIGRALKGAGKKCLILDCDNTLWGGVVGEAGLEGIALDPTTYPGKAFHDFQKVVVRLAEQGMMVALCSKNNPEDVMEVLDAHPHCLLKRRHLAAYRVNWEGKEQNIQAIVEELNIGMDAVVFVDDSAVECERVKAFLPEVVTRQVPKQLSDLPLLIDREGFFDKLAVTAEDLKRAALYQAEAQRREVATTFASVEEFLATLELTARIERVSAARIPRVAQLTQKTNQFNLTTRRYSEGDIAKMATDPDCAVFTLTAADRFGDLGLTGVLIARRHEDGAVVDTFLMSCRVLGRKLEHEFVARCVEALDERWQPRRWRAEYVKTAKNGQVAEFWPLFGFKEETHSAGSTGYGADRTALTLEHAPYIKVETA